MVIKNLTKLLMIKMTGHCPNVCVFCLNADGEKKKAKLKKSEILKIVKHFMPKKVELTGGEPLSDMPLLINTVKNIKKIGVKEIRVNSTLDLKNKNNPLTFDDIDLIGKLGSTEIFICIQTLDEKKYVLLRGNKEASLKRVLENISFLLENTNLLFVPSFVPTIKNYLEFPRIYNYVCKLSEKYPGRVLPLEYCKLIIKGRASEKIAVSFEKQFAMLRKIKIIHPIESWCFGNNSSKLKKMGINVYSCSFGKDSFYVDVGGEVYPDNSCGKSMICKDYSKFDLKKYMQSSEAKNFFCSRAYQPQK